MIGNLNYDRDPLSPVETHYYKQTYLGSAIVSGCGSGKDIDPQF